jgi:hypothetical protein
MQILLKAIVDEEVVTIFKAPTKMLLEGRLPPESTDNNIELGDLINALITKNQHATNIMKANHILEQALQFAWVRDAYENRNYEAGLRNCLKGIRLDDLKGGEQS